jgi:L-lactate dehydrogenase complex protein LldG
VIGIESKERGLMTQDLFAHFQQRLTAAGGSCHLLKDLPEAATVIAEHPALEAKEIVIPPGLGERAPWGKLLRLLQRKGIQLREASTPAAVADAPAGLSSAELAVAETGSVLLAENSLEGRIVSMLTLTNFVLVRASDLVPMLDQAGAYLQRLTKPGPEQRRYVSLVTGPSRTADIERTLTIGVQGPKALCVLIVQEGSSKK